jgi:hypothetical protein
MPDAVRRQRHHDCTNRPVHDRGDRARMDLPEGRSRGTPGTAPGQRSLHPARSSRKRGSRDGSSGRGCGEQGRRPVRPGIARRIHNPRAQPCRLYVARLVVRPLRLGHRQAQTARDGPQVRAVRGAGLQDEGGVRAAEVAGADDPAGAGQQGLRVGGVEKRPDPATPTERLSNSPG